ncbi:ferrous iron transport protein B [Dissulfurispira thermophila]|uniref:Ferrous iron transport protein B n=2 Tax=root TaxID=1 RepID=A0A7G1GZS8_9BACT|nr:ferrous iron transport protein B [Dissulfurispira thermophila]BCB95894.1 ferrous iron transport protein B [Dissulfurispira thermophila]
MHEHKPKTKRQPINLEKIALIGNPNVGKSVIFGLLTGKYVTVSNYPGTTVEITQGNISLGNKRLLLIDTPGVNSLIPMSEDEKVTRDILLTEAPSTVVQVGDAKNLKRTLLITLQLSEMGFPMVLALNMIDEAMDRGISIDIESLKNILGINVVGTVAPQRKGIKELKEAMVSPEKSKIQIKYNPVIEDYIQKISKLLPPSNISQRSLSIMILSEDESLRDWLKANVKEDALTEIERLRDECKLKFRDSVGYLINKTRIDAAEEIVSRVIKKSSTEGGKLLNFIGSISMHPVYGIPVLLAVLYGLYEFVGVFGAGTLVGFMEETIFNGYINPAATKVVKLLMPIELLQELLVGEYGLITVALTYAIAIILPITVTFFIAFAVLEDSGYLPRLAIMSNKVFNIIGLNGKAVLPMVLGLGCGTMAVMTSRILETKRDRIITTFLLALAIPCSAQLGVILGMLGALSLRATIIWVSTILVVLFISGFLASKIVSGERTEFFLEIPPIRMPNIMNIIVKTAGRVEWYLREAVPLFILGTFILFVLHKFNILIHLERLTSPVVVNLLNLPAKTSEAFILGFLRRDYGAAGLFTMAQQGMLTPIQSIVSLVTITLFVPCLANFFMIIKERGLKTALWIIAIVFPSAFLFGGMLNWILRYFNMSI